MRQGNSRNLIKFISLKKKKPSTDFQSKMNYYIAKRAGVLFQNIPGYIQLYHATNFIFNNLWITTDHADIDL